MPRKPRKISKTNIYHVMCRGNNKSDIFFEDDDYVYYLDLLKNVKNNNNFFIYAYCLMKNHVHLLIDFKDISISKIMHKINSNYAFYINKKYQKIGHLFQGRFKSEAVENEGYLLTVFRYIHNNPVKAEFSVLPEEYKWSSYQDYLGTGDRHSCPLADINFILSLFSFNLNNFIEYSLAYNNDNIIDLKDEKRIKITTLKQAEKYVIDFLKIHNIDLNKNKRIKDKNIRNKLIKDLKEISSLSIVNISKLLELGTKIIRRA